MVQVTTVDGHVIYTSDDAISIITGPYPFDVGPHTYVYGITRAVIVTAEAPQALVARLRPEMPLVLLTRPNDTPIWLKAAAVTSVQVPLSTDNPAANAMLSVGSFHPQVKETVEQVRAAVNVAGGDI